MYIQGFLLAVPEDNKDAYAKMANDAWPFFAKHGAIEMVEGWEADVRDGKHTDFRMATKAQDGEKIVFSWVIWPDRETCDKASESMMNDPEMKMPDEMPFDGKRMIWGGFTPVFTSGRDN